jgi:5-methylcytosine-specific restriction endonuclease McrA
MRDGLTCVWCSKSFTWDDPATLEHIIPVAKGGTDRLGNVVLAHGSCNGARHHLGAIKYLNRLKSWGFQPREALVVRRYAEAKALIDRGFEEYPTEARERDQRWSLRRLAA